MGTPRNIVPLKGGAAFQAARASQSPRSARPERPRPHSPRFLAVRLALAISTAPLVHSCATSAAPSPALRVVSATAAPELDALFQRTNGWLGADGNYSVAVTGERTLWFFSDTWLGEIANDRRTNATMINNSVGVQSGRGAAARVEFFWRTNEHRKPAAPFLPADGHGWFWPVGGAMTGGRVSLLLWQMEKASGPAAFGFRHAAVWLGEIENPLDPPPQWRVRQTKLPFTELTPQRHLVFGAAALAQGEHLYVFGTDERPGKKEFGRRMALARAPADAPGDFSRWRFFSDGEWVEDFRRATPLAPGMASEYSVTPLATGGFVTVTHDVLLSPRIVARTAPQPWGPWSEAVEVFCSPEAGWKKGIFCYAGKAHPSLSRGDELIITYAANAHSLADVIRDPRLYWPRFVRAKWAPALSNQQ